MARIFVFADEAGDFEFSTQNNVSRYFILCTVAMESCAIGAALLELRRELIWDRYEVGDCFHATTDSQVVRDRVFGLICRHQFSVQATIMEKAKAQPQVRRSKPRFYHYGWFYHFKFVAPKILNADSELHTTAASLGTKKERASYIGTINDVMRQTVGTRRLWVTDFCPAASDPCVQVADYCAWAIQRRWERQDPRSYDLIKDRINHEADMWERGTTRYY